MTRPISDPDPDPVRPKYAPPPQACDAHCHIFGPAGKFPYAPERRYTPPDSPKEKLRALHEGGVRGVRFNFARHLGGAPDARVFERALAMIEPLGWHVVLHFDAEDIESHAGLFRRLRAPFVIDHMGRVQAQHGLDQKPFRMLLGLMKNELAWVKVSGPERVSAGGKPFRDALPFAAALVEAAPQRVLWGTDFPHPNVEVMPNDGELVDLFAEMVPDEGLRKRILVDNPARLYWADVKASVELSSPACVRRR